MFVSELYEKFTNVQRTKWQNMCICECSILETRLEIISFPLKNIKSEREWERGKEIQTTYRKRIHSKRNTNKTVLVMVCFCIKCFSLIKTDETRYEMPATKRQQQRRRRRRQHPTNEHRTIFVYLNICTILANGANFWELLIHIIFGICF